MIIPVGRLEGTLGVDFAGVVVQLGAGVKASPLRILPLLVMPRVFSERLLAITLQRLKLGKYSFSAYANILKLSLVF